MTRWIFFHGEAYLRDARGVSLGRVIRVDGDWVGCAPDGTERDIFARTRREAMHLVEDAIIAAGRAVVEMRRRP